MAMTAITTLDNVAVQRAKSGDINALEQVYRAYEGTVYHLARRICRTEEDAEGRASRGRSCRSVAAFRRLGVMVVAG